MGRYGDWNEDEERGAPSRRFEPNYDDISLGRGVGPHYSGAVTTVGVITIIVGSLIFLVSSCGLLGVFVESTENRHRNRNDADIGLVFVMIFSFSLLLWSVGMVTGGIGILNRAAWGRMLTMILAGFGILFGIAGFILILVLMAAPGPAGRNDGRIAGVMGIMVLEFLIVGHALWAFIGLLNARATAEFR